MKTAIIIEDELDAQLLLKSIIEDYCPDIKVIGVAECIKSGKALIALQPDIVFLDIQLGASSGFQIIEDAPQRSFKLIVTTAFEEYALKAFQYEAIAYLLKPYSPKAVISAVTKAEKIIQDNLIYANINTLVNTQLLDNKLSLPTSEGYEIVHVDHIVNIEADRSYCKVYIESKKPLLVSKPMKEFETILPNNYFFRSHTSHLINLRRLTQYRKEDGGFAVMTNGNQVPISRRKKNEFLELLKSGVLNK